MKVKLVQSFEEACAVKGYDPATVLPDVTNCPAHLQQAITDSVKILVVNEALRVDENTGEEWVPDWNDFSQYKYYPWFDLEVTKDNPSGFRFHGSDCAYAYSGVGSRRVYPTAEIARYAGTKFADLHRSVMLIENK